MASDVEICNRAASKIGEARIISLDDDTKASRAFKSAFAIVRDSELRANRWSFAKKRTTLPALSATPAYGWAYQYQLPSDFLQVIQVGESMPGVNLADYRASPMREWEVEGTTILSNTPPPLKLRYVRRVLDTALFDSCFVEALACRLAYEVAEELTQSTGKKQVAMQEYDAALKAAIRANAIELPSEDIQDESWIMGRL